MVIELLTLGISGGFSDSRLSSSLWFHDAAACLVEDGETLAAVEEERLNRIKKTNAFPSRAIKYCLAQYGVDLSAVDRVAYYFDEPFTDSVVASNVEYTSPNSLGHSRALIQDRLRETLDWEYPIEKIVYTPHHLSHAMSTYARSGMANALVIVMDGQGEADSATIFEGKAGRLTRLASYSASKSLGQLYFCATRILGYGVGDEYKVMGLAPYGDPHTYRNFFQSLYQLGEGGAYEITPDIPAGYVQDFDYLAPLCTINGIRRRANESPIKREHMDFSAALQETLETIALHVIGHWRKTTGLSNLCFGGGVAHNSALNGKILASEMFDELFVHPASHDAGAAEGAALSAQSDATTAKRIRGRMRSAYLGPEVSEGIPVDVRLDEWREVVSYELCPDIAATGARLLANGAILGWAAGRSEFGPRALGNRSILADPRPSENRDRVNQVVKEREGYRPFAPVVTENSAKAYFELPECEANYDFMSFLVPVKQAHRTLLGAVTHVDGTARVQIVSPHTNARFHDLVHHFGELTGVPVLLNTSFNNSVEPIVQSVHDAMTAFLTTELDYLVIDDYLISKSHSREETMRRLVPNLGCDADLASTMPYVGRGFGRSAHYVHLRRPGRAPRQITDTTFDFLRRLNGRSTTNEILRDGEISYNEVFSELSSLWRDRFLVMRPHCQAAV